MSLSCSLISLGALFGSRARGAASYMPADLPVDRETCAALWDKEADLRNGALESAYYTALNITVAAPTVTAWKKPRKQYMCSHCAGARCQKRVTFAP